MRGVFLDFDGVICDSEYYFSQYEPLFFSKAFPNLDPIATTFFQGRNFRVIFNELKQKETSVISFSEFEKGYLEMCDKIYYELTKIQDGICDFIKEFKKLEIPVAVVSSSNRRYIDFVLEKYDLFTYVDLIISIEDVGSKCKPSPYPYELAKKKLFVTEGVCIEDSDSGIKSGEGAGLFVYRYTPYSVVPDESSFNSISDIKKQIFKKWRLE